MILDLFRKEVEFKNIQGYDDIKEIVKRALDAEDNYNLLFIGPPAGAKTLFLTVKVGARGKLFHSHYKIPII